MITKLENIKCSEGRGAENPPPSSGIRLLTLLLIFIGFAAFACAPAPTNGNRTINSNATASTTMNANTAESMNANTATGVSSAAFAIKEP